MTHTIVIVDVPLTDDDGFGTMFRHVPGYATEGMDAIMHLSDLEPFDRDMLASIADNPVFEILYYAGDVTLSPPVVEDR